MKKKTDKNTPPTSKEIECKGKKISMYDDETFYYFYVFLLG